MALLEVDALRAGFDAVDVLHGVSLCVASGEVLGLIGPNGAGKTTLLRVLAGLHAGRGRLLFSGTDLQGVSTEARVVRGLVFVPDSRGTLLSLTVEENLRLGAHTRGDREGVREDLQQVFRRFPELAGRRRQQAGTLSGGEQQMLAIGRALMARPALLMIDEPTAGLAPQMIDRIQHALAAIRDELGLALLFAEQESSRIGRLADRLLLLDAGQIVIQGAPAEVQSHPALRERFLGAMPA